MHASHRKDALRAVGKEKKFTYCTISTSRRQYSATSACPPHIPHKARDTNSVFTRRSATLDVTFRIV